VAGASGCASNRESPLGEGCLQSGTAGDLALFPSSAQSERRARMLYWAMVFLVIAIIAGVLGFGGIASTAAGIAKILFFIFLVVFLVALATGMARRRGPPI
jgi:uncharacterized membrane protein YtjA (UPF0391 family)